MTTRRPHHDRRKGRSERHSDNTTNSPVWSEAEPESLSGPAFLLTIGKSSVGYRTISPSLDRRKQACERGGYGLAARSHRSVSVEFQAAGPCKQAEWASDPRATKAKTSCPRPSSPAPSQTGGGVEPLSGWKPISRRWFGTCILADIACDWVLDHISGIASRSYTHPDAPRPLP